MMMPSKLIIGTFLSFVCAVSIAIMLNVTRSNTREQLPQYGKVADFSGRDQDGDDFFINKLNGHIWVGNFFFTSCGGPCPLMTKRMKELGEELKSVENLRMLSITLDPETDTPTRLAKYAKKHSQSPKNASNTIVLKKTQKANQKSRLNFHRAYSRAAFLELLVGCWGCCSF